MQSYFKINIIALVTLLRKETGRIFRIWPQTLLPSAITTALYFIVFGGFIGSKLGLIAGVSYMNFLAPGFIIMVIITNAYNNVASSFFAERFQNSHQELIWAPLSFHTIVCGYCAGGIIRALLNGIIVTMISLFFTNIHIMHILTMLYSAIITAVLFSLLGFMNALFATRFDSITTIPNFVLTPLTYLGGVFYSIQSLPEPWHQISIFNPLLYIINSFRYGMLGISDVPVNTAIVTIACVTASIYIACIQMLKKGTGVTE